ncbi:MAG: ATP-dependent DNA ligase [Candidatus Bathyarchaeia archaeon]
MGFETPFMELAMLCDRLEKTTKRLEKSHMISSFLLRLKEEEIQPAVSFILGRAFPESDSRVLGVGGKTVWRIMRRERQTALVQTPLMILGAYRQLEAVAAASGKGSRLRKESILQNLFSQSSPLEAKYIVRMLLGEMRIGVVEGVMLEAISEAASVELALVRRSHMFLGNLGEVARIALREGEAGLKGVGVRLFKPIKPMLAEMSYDLAEVFAEQGGRTAFEYKFDGARIQVHKLGRNVRIFSRRLTDVTKSLPDIVELVRDEVRSEEALIEGEVVAIGEGGKPLPFQDLMRRFRRVHRVMELVKEIPLRLYLFDIVYLDGRSLVDTPYEERWKLLAQTCEPNLLAKRIVTEDMSEAQAFLDEAIRSGFEGLMAKALDSDYTPGVRGKKWFKIKPAEYLDLVIIAADWGYGRRTGWLSNYHLAARDDKTGEFVVIGKTFKGLSDDEFREMTSRLQAIKTSEDDYTVRVKPGVVVEIAYNEIQRSPHYKSGFALRFARITRMRDDKGPEDADTIERVRELYEKQFEYKAKKLFS